MPENKNEVEIKPETDLNISENISNQQDVNKENKPGVKDNLSEEKSAEDVKPDNLMKCPACGKEISDKELFCPECGLN